MNTQETPSFLRRAGDDVAADQDFRHGRLPEMRHPVHAEDARGRTVVVEREDRDRARRDAEAVVLAEVRAEVVGEDDADDAGVGDDGDRFAGRGIAEGLLDGADGAVANLPQSSPPGMRWESGSARKRWYSSDAETSS